MRRTLLVAIAASGVAALVAGCMGAAAPHAGASAPGGRPAVTRVVVRFPGRAGTHRRTLTCAPDRGGYRDPAAACRALRDLARLERHPIGVLCACRTVSIPDRTIVGHIGRRHVRFVLGACAPCPLGGAAGEDMRILMPA